MAHDDMTNDLLARALGHLRSTLQLLDLAAAPGQIAAHVDLGACQLADFIESLRQPARENATVPAALARR